MPGCSGLATVLCWCCESSMRKKQFTPAWGASWGMFRLNGQMASLWTQSQLEVWTQQLLKDPPSFSIQIPFFPPHFSVAGTEGSPAEAHPSSDTARDGGKRASQWVISKESACQCRRRGFNPWVGKIPWRRAWQPTPVFLPGKSRGQRSLAGYSPRGRKRIRHDWATEQL